MTQGEFVAFYPQFTGFTPAVVLSTFVEQANARFGNFSTLDAAEARRLYVAHKLTMYARTVPSSNGTPTKSELAAAGRFAGYVSSKKVGEVSVTYASGSASGSSVSTGLADLTETEYGLQLLAIIRLYARSRYVP